MGCKFKLITDLRLLSWLFSLTTLEVDRHDGVQNWRSATTRKFHPTYYVTFQTKKQKITPFNVLPMNSKNQNSELHNSERSDYKTKPQNLQNENHFETVSQKFRTYIERYKAKITNRLYFNTSINKSSRRCLRRNSHSRKIQSKQLL